MSEHPGVSWLLENGEQLRELSNNWVALTENGPVEDSDGIRLAHREISGLLSALEALGIPADDVAFHLVDHPTWGDR